MQHAPGFLKLVEAARSSVPEVTVEQLRERMARNPHLVLLDVREDLEWQAGHAVGAEHLGKGVLERDIEERVPEPATEVVLYCGGGYRSLLAGEVARRMGYSNVHSLAGGYRALVASGWEIARD